MKFKESFKNIGYLFKETFSEFINDNVLKLSATLSYYIIFALPPLLIIVISWCGLYFGPQAIQGELYGQIKDLVGSPAALQIQEIIKNVNLSTHSTFTTIIGVIILVIGASGVFGKYRTP
jgi:membrane protein